ncbi:MAG: glutamate--tRNA ligase [Desulfovibrio sp.]|jgi:glutamyl-tRNA synthetase|nr:glutamate--tRNA ligase [Desulfovibrio sp.]
MNDQTSKKVITRFAPSPTGHLHIGGARTAIFCWLMARHFGGKFLLRIEDTDIERSRQEYTESILSSMRWLKLDWDDEPVFQRGRFYIYDKNIERLLESGHAYWCACSPEEVETMRERARAAGEKPRYDGRCRNLHLGPGPGRVVRLAAPMAGRIEFTDMAKGRLSFDASELDDMVLRRADGAPTYNFSVVVDDIAMNVSHVLRGDDHVNNTPRQILIYRALGADLPVFGHVPMILGPDRQKLSKRHGAKAVIEYEKDGLLPEALVNYLVRLGWSQGDKEIFSREELVAAFNGKNLSGSPAAFDPEKLLWVNARHLREAKPEDILPLLLPFLEEAGAPMRDRTLLLGAISLFQPRARTLKDLAEQMRTLLIAADELHYDGEILALLGTEGCGHLVCLGGKIDELPDFCPETLHQCLRAYVEERGVKFKAVGQAMRIALLGSVNGPDLAGAMAILGKDEVRNRLDRTLAQFSAATNHI